MNFFKMLFFPKAYREEKKKGTRKIQKALELLSKEFKINSRNTRTLLEAVKVIDIREINKKELDLYDVEFYHSYKELLEFIEIISRNIKEADHDLDIRDFVKEPRKYSFGHWSVSEEGFYIEPHVIFDSVIPMVEILLEELEFSEEYQDRAQKEFNARLTFFVLSDIINLFHLVINEKVRT